MLKRDEYITLINELKSISPTISDEQRKGLLRRGVQQYGLSVEEATDILNVSGLSIGEKVDYYDVLGLSILDIENRSESEIVALVEAAHTKLYSASLKAGGRPRSDGRTEEQWRTLLNQARDTLIDVQKRQAHIVILQNSDIPTNRIISKIESIPPETESIPLRTSEQDSMVLIPAGEFDMGSDDYDIPEYEKPLHSVYVDAFYMDKYLVTNAQYKEFIDANPQWRNLGWHNLQLIFRNYRDSDYLKNWFMDKYPTVKAQHPVTWVSWHAAMAYAKWVGKRLPTEAEWEKAARGGLTGQRYPWGQIVGKANYDKSVGETTPVDKYPMNGYGLFDIVGNVSEWCLDKWDNKFYQFSQERNPVSGGNIESIIDYTTKSNTHRVIRGGSWYSSEQELRVTYRDRLAASKTSSLVGFRCVKTINT